MQIEQIDRDAAADLMLDLYGDRFAGDRAARERVLRGEDDASIFVRGYARHRLAALSARPAVGEDVVERVARALHADRNALDGMCYADAELKDWGDGDLKATVDGEVNFSALARAAIVALCGADMGKGGEG